MDNLRAELPEKFRSLEPFLDDWAFATERERFGARVTNKLEKITAFYEGVAPLMKEIVDYLNQFPLGEMPERARRLFYLALAFMEVSHPVELKWGKNDIVDAFPPDRFEIVSPS